MGGQEARTGRTSGRIGTGQSSPTEYRITPSWAVRLLLVAILVVGPVGTFGTAAVGEVSVESMMEDDRFAVFGGSSTSALTAVDDVTAPSPVGFVLVGYSRLIEGDSLEHDTRRAIYETVVASPGTYVTEVAAATDTPVSTIRYHVRVLTDENVVRTPKIGGKRRLFPASPGDDLLAAAFNDDATAAVIEAIRWKEPITVSELAEELDRSQSTISYHLTRLDDADIVDRERDGESVLVSLTAPVRTAVDLDAYTDA